MYRMNDASRSAMTDATDELYREFAIPAPPVIEGCPCCIDTRGVDALLTMPLRQLSGDALWRYTTGAFLTVGGERDFRYLLPRIFEIASVDAGDSPGAEIVLGKLKRANWKTWPERERRAIEEFVNAWFDHVLADGLKGANEGWPDGLRTESVVCGAAIAGMPISRWLERLKSPSSQPVLEDLRASYPRSHIGFWKEAPEAFQELCAKLEIESAK
jgi:hypothetical protein